MLQVNLKRFVKFRLEEEKRSNQSVANQSEDENKENQRKGNQFLFLIIVVKNTQNDDLFALESLHV